MGLDCILINYLNVFPIYIYLMADQSQENVTYSKRSQHSIVIVKPAHGGAVRVSTCGLVWFNV